MPKGIYIRTEKHKQNISKSKLGKKHSKQARENMGKSHKGKKRPEHSKWMKGKNNPMFGKKRPDTSKRNKLMSGKDSPRFGKVPAHSKGAYYKEIWMRSNWEILFAQFLDLSGYKYKYESKIFDLGNTTYTPDFYLPEKDLYIEVKGYWRDNAKKKFKLFKKLYPNIKIKVLMKKELQKLGIKL